MTKALRGKFQFSQQHRQERQRREGRKVRGSDGAPFHLRLKIAGKAMV
jgi:hypothetical protein